MEKFGEWEGVDGAISGLKHVDAKTGGSILRGWNRKTIKKVVVPRQEGSIHSKRARNNLKVQATRGSKTAIISGPGSDTYWERFLQGGTKQRTTKRGFNRGKIKKDNRLEKTYDGLVQPVINYAKDNAGKEICKLFNSRLKSANKRIIKHQ